MPEFGRRRPKIGGYWGGVDPFGGYESLGHSGALLDGETGEVVRQ
jgi:hypothetical protein